MWFLLSGDSCIFLNKSSSPAWLSCSCCIEREWRGGGGTVLPSFSRSLPLLCSPFFHPPYLFLFSLLLLSLFLPTTDNLCRRCWGALCERRVRSLPMSLQQSGMYTQTVLSWAFQHLFACGTRAVCLFSAGNRALGFQIEVPVAHGIRVETARHAPNQCAMLFGFTHHTHTYVRGKSATCATKGASPLAHS